MMKTAVILLLVAVAVSKGAVIDGPSSRFIMVTGSIGPDDKDLGSIREIYYAPPGITLISSEVNFHMPNAKLRIAKIQMIEHSSSGAVAVITSGGVGSDHVKIKLTPYNNRPYDFEVSFWGNYTLYEINSKAEIVSSRTSHTVPTSVLEDSDNFLL